MESLKLFMVLLGCTPPRRNTEQHDIFFGVASELRDLVPEMLACWPEANNRIHIDSWREVSVVDGYRIEVFPRKETMHINDLKLFFLNLGGYKKNEFEEYHYKMLTVSSDMGGAIRSAKETAFYKHTGFKNAESHIDDKYGIDVDDIYLVEDIFPEEMKKKYAVRISHSSGEDVKEDELHIGYFKLNKI